MRMWLVQGKPFTVEHSDELCQHFTRGACESCELEFLDDLHNQWWDETTPLYWKELYRDPV